MVKKKSEGELTFDEQRQKLLMDRRDALFELKQIDFEREGIPIAAYRKEKELGMRKEAALQVLEQINEVLKELEVD